MLLAYCVLGCLHAYCVLECLHAYWSWGESTLLGLAWTICILCKYGTCGREITKYIGLARTVYIRIYTPYIWWFPSQKYRMYTVYIWFWPTLQIYGHIRCIYTVLANYTPNARKEGTVSTISVRCWTSLPLNSMQQHPFFVVHCSLIYSFLYDTSPVCMQRNLFCCLL